MVRTREKKAKGDDAFTTRKQKVGRKKLAPATATRAEVHARTLRLSTSATMTAAMAAPLIADPATHPASSETTTASARGRDRDAARKRPVVAVQSFAELLSGMQHYKAAQRASAFATFTRLLHQQNDHDAAEAVRRGGATGTGAFDVYMRHAAGDATAAAAGASARLHGLSSLERLKGFAAALEAITDTDDDVRREALQSLRVLVDYHWISPARDGVSAPIASPSSSTATHGTADLVRCNSLLLAKRASDDGGWNSSSAAPLDDGVGGTAAGSISSAAVDRVQAVMQAVHVALTHALKPVRLSGVELLSLLLRVAPPSLVRAAARAVCQHQHSYYHASPAVMASTGLAMREATAVAGDAATTALAAAQARAAALLEEEERWMLMLVRRVSALVLRTKHVAVLPALLVVVLGEGESSDDAAGDAITAALLLRASSLVGGDTVCATGAALGGDEGGSGRAIWRHPELVNAFFDDVAPQWANHWKELMEMRLELLRQDEKLATASALARSFATVLVFLKRQQQQQQQQQRHLSDAVSRKRGGAVHYLSRNRVHYIKALFIDKMPVTMQELLLPVSTTVSAAAMRARLELGLALVMVCVPLAGTEEGWHLMRDYYTIVFAVPGNAAAAPELPAATFSFPSIALLETSVRLFTEALQLYPCVAPNLRVSSTTGDGASTHDDEVCFGAVGVPLVARPDAQDEAGRRRRTSSSTREHAEAVGGEAASSLQHSTVSERLLTLFPGALRTIIKHLTPYADSGRSSGGTSADDPALVRVLLCAVTLLERFAALPEEVLRRGERVGAKGSSSSSTTTTTTVAVARLEEGFALVPRLLFALREQTQTQTPVGGKRARASVEEDDDGVAAVARAGGAVAPSVTRTGVLLPYSGVVDLLVRRLLQVLWFMGSSGHPLLHRSGGGPPQHTAANARAANSAAASSSSSPSAVPLAALLSRSIQFLFGGAGVDGVLQRCSAPTVLLAHSTLYYLSQSGAGAAPVVETAPSDSGAAADTMAVAATRWADVMEAMHVVRATTRVAA
ncbi:Rix1 complex component involved in 60S ribosome maturation [Novymonas esmeraldas]|uniref:Rix1 complex component involved in 60S ribosome maturation n=1 Tax=Novymonas esmeraldas TaxID=1808958 RepID=A0AAW0ESX1_9TRYP